MIAGATSVFLAALQPWWKYRMPQRFWSHLVFETA